MDVIMAYETKKHILSLIVENQPGVLSRIVGLFSGRGFNIESLCVAETAEADISRITLVTLGDMDIIEQIKKQLNKLINVIKVIDLTHRPFVARDMALIKVRARPENRAEILRMVDIFRARVVDVGALFYTVEVIGDLEKIRSLINLLTPMGIKEVARTGTIALPRELKKIAGKDRFWWNCGRCGNIRRVYLGKDAEDSGPGDRGGAWLRGPGTRAGTQHEG